MKEQINQLGIPPNALTPFGLADTFPPEPTSYSEAIELEHADYVKDEYFESKQPPRTKPAHGIPWSPTKMLGRRPSSGQSASISRALSDLEKRKLLKRHSATRPANRTTHVELTVWGAIASVKLQLQQKSD